MGSGLTVHCPIIFCNTGNDRKVWNLIIPKCEPLPCWEKQAPCVCWNLLAMPLLAEKTMHSKNVSCLPLHWGSKRHPPYQWGRLWRTARVSAKPVTCIGVSWSCLDSQIAVLMRNHISLYISSKCTLVTNSFMHVGLLDCNLSLGANCNEHWKFKVDDSTSCPIS